MVKATEVCYIQIYVHLIIYLNLLDYSIVSLNRELKLVLTIYIFFFQVELSLEAANLAQRNATLGISDSSAGKFSITLFALCPCTL
jgi:hypothetical protein